jgi:CheY-like chemotaxis protein
VPSILVADDNTNIQKMVTLAFEDRGITVVAVGNGEAAVRRMPDLNPDLVLADIFMPVRNGYEVCEFVKKDQRFAHVPVILLVGAFDPLDEKEARRVGADGVLKKPFVPPDPLIAMVISALEKNPRVVAELAKAKASLEPHAMPDAGASFEVQTLPKPEPKPLPDFPEPSPEEAALVYGFGKGVRTLDDDEKAVTAKEPPPPVAEADEEEGKDFETADSARDWRRTAMDFEISAEDASRPAFSTVDGLDPTDFFPFEDDDRKAEHHVEPPVAAVPETMQSFAPAVSDEVELPMPEHAEPIPVEARAPVSVPMESEAAPPAAIESRAVTSEPQLESAHEARPSLASRMRHWMDTLVSSPPHEGTKDDGDWMAALSQPQATEVAAVEEPPAPPAPPETTALAVVNPAEESFFAEESALMQAAPIETPVEPAAEAISAVTENAETGEVAGSEVAPIEVHAPVVEASESSKDAAPEPKPEIWDRVEETAPSYRDPNLVVPAAVRVTPEPLLVDEDYAGPSNYGEHQEEVAAAHTFEVPAFPEPVAEDATVEQSSFSGPSSESAAGESVADETGELIPTGPPPNREALAEIPFLNPPRDFDANVHAAPQSPAIDASTVDVIVQRVLEKLQPQLHDLLSQGVLKPLVENLLQQELTKKNE